jgi:hypothetical protein
MPIPVSTQVTQGSIRTGRGLNMSNSAATHRGTSLPVATQHLPVVSQPASSRTRLLRPAADSEDVVLRYSDSSLAVQPEAVEDEDEDPIGYDWEALAEYR